MSIYTASGGKGKIEFTQMEAVAKMEELYKIVVDLFHGFDYKKSFGLQPRGKTEFPFRCSRFYLGFRQGQEQN